MRDTPTNGASIHVATVAQLNDRVARYRTALTALLEIVDDDRKSYTSYGRQQLIKQVKLLLDEES